MASTPLFYAGPRNEPTVFTPAHATRPRVLWTPGSSGSEIRAISVATNDAGANQLQLSIGRKVSLEAAMGTGALVDNGGSADTITRTSGSFITDGWVAGDRLVLVGATTLANNFEDILTAVAAQSLSLASGGGTVDTAEDLPDNSYLARLARWTYLAVPAGSGLPTAVAVSGLDTTQAPSLDASPDRNLPLGPNDVLFGAVTTTMGTGETLDVTVAGFDY